jgi:hypothetical protein
MSLNRLHKERPRVSTHFEEVQVAIQVLNGALRNTRRFVDLDPWGGVPSGDGVDESDSASGARNRRAVSFANERRPVGDVRGEDNIVHTFCASIADQVHVPRCRDPPISSGPRQYVIAKTARWFVRWLLLPDD